MNRTLRWSLMLALFTALLLAGCRTQADLPAGTLPPTARATVVPTVADSLAARPSATSTATQTPTLSPPPLIAFVSAFDLMEMGVNDIYTINSQSHKAEIVCCSINLDGAGNAGDPAWSFDGRQLALVSDRTGLDQILFFNPRGDDIFLSDGTANDREPAWSPDGSQIVFVSDRSGDNDLFIMNADGSGVRHLTAGSALDGSPAWSPDGRWIAFHSTRSGNGDLYLIQPEGGEPVRLTDAPANDGAPDWSPDGKQIVFMSQRDGGNWNVFTLEVASGEATRLTDHPADDEYPAWSGEQIAFMSARTGDFELYVMNVDGSAQTRLTYWNGVDGYPSWSSKIGAPRLATPALFSGPTDGERIVFGSDRDGNDHALWVMAADGGQQARLDTVLNLDEQGRAQPFADWDAQWSPDGKQVVFVSDRFADNHMASNTWVIDADGTDLRLISSGGDSPTWGPDSRSVALFYLQGHEITTVSVVHLDGSTGPNLIDNRDVPMQMDPAVEWSPDGRRVVFQGASLEPWTWGIWVINVDGSGLRLVVENAYSPAWSPDGQKIAFMRAEDIWAVNSDGTEAKLVFDAPGEVGASPGTLLRDLCPTWGPDGRHLAFDSDIDGDYEIYVINLDGSGLTRLTDNDANDTCPDWSWK